jgi:N-sulfoglucosamine sulfohydrolase
MESMDGLSFAAMEKAAATDPAIAKRVKMLVQRQPEELYHIAEDPACLKNCSGHKKELERLNAFREHLDGWMKAKEDDLLPFHRSYLTKVKGAYRADATR